GTELLEHVGKRLGESRSKHACELDVGACGIGQGTKDIEDRALPDLFARATGMFHCRMELGCEHETNADLLDRLGDLLGREVQVDAQCREYIRASTLRGGGPI